MKTQKSIRNLGVGLLAFAVAPSITLAAPDSDDGYIERPLVSDIATNAPHLDSRLVNPWGIVAGPGALWVNDNGPGLITAYGPEGNPVKYAITIPGPGTTAAGTPSGLVFNDTLQFTVADAHHVRPATFLAATEDGTIAAWNQAINGSNAVLVIDNSASGAVYKGVAIARDTNGEPRLYAANFHAGRIDVFDGQYHPVQSFTDTTVPAGFAPFGIRNIRGTIFVSFALQKLPDAHDDQAGPGNGYVDIFSVDGVLLRRLVSQGALNSPWGMVVAPHNFGQFKNALLIGNFGDGKINAYDLLTGELLGNLKHKDGSDIVISGLWGLAFETDNLDPWDRDCDNDAHRLYFTAGLNSEADGLLGLIHPAE